MAKADLEYYDHILDISRERFKAGDIAEIDFSRIELTRVQYESEVQTAIVNLRTAKIQLLQMLNDRTPLEQFDVNSPFDFSDAVQPLDDYRQMALSTRPDLAAALESSQQAQTNHKLAISTGSTDPTFSAWYTWNSSNNNPNGLQTIGGSVNIPLRIFDRNQGEKARTQIEIDRTHRLQEIATAQVYADVDSALSTLNGNITLLRAYKAKYLDEAAKVRDTISFAYQNGGASLLDFLNAQNEYRSIRLSYLNLVGSYFTAANQVNLAVGREVIQ
jgi:cobalt-zinc-cadmium efflux system outer membrane protein